MELGRCPAKALDGAGVYNEVMAVPFDLVVSVVDDEAVVAVKGELDFHSAPKLREQIVELLGLGVQTMIIDLSELEFIDSSGLGVLVAGLKRLRDSDGKFLLRSPSVRTAKVLQVSGLDKLFPVG